MPVTTMIEDTEFTCPLCGSHKWGTSCDELAAFNDLPASERTVSNMSKIFDEHAIGWCHGYTSAGPCQFKWQRRDDAKHFRGLGTYNNGTSTGRAP